MYRGADDRGVSEVVGFILVFGMLVISFTVYQGIVVPDQNRQVEFQHNQEVQGDLQDLRNAIVRTAATGSGEAVSVTLGARYPDRTIAQNLGVSAGAVETIDTGGGLRIENVRATDPETRHYVDGSIGPFESKAIRYTPVYSFYGGAPRTTYENTFAFNKFSSENLTLTDQLVVDGRRITLVAVSGNLSAAHQDTVSVSTEAISVSSNRVLVQNTSGQEVTLTIPTTANASVWEEVLADEMGSSGHVVDVSAVPGMDAVDISLEQGETYELRMAKVGVGTGAADEPAVYLTDAAGNDATVPAGGTHELVVEVRDRYNNPVSGVEVNVSDVSGGATVSPSDSTLSDADGRASLTYTAPGAAGPESVTLSIDDASSDREEVTFSLSVQGGAGGGGAGDPGSGAYGIFWQQPSGDPGLEGGCDTEDCTWNLDADSDSELTLTAGTQPSLDGIDVDFATDDPSVAAISSADAETGSGGTANLDVQAGSNGEVGLYVVSGGSSDRINVTVEGLDLVYNGDAEATPGTDPNLNSVVEFSLTNEGSGSIAITDITVESSSQGAQIRERQSSLSEVMIDTNGDGSTDVEADSGDGFVSAGYDIGEQVSLPSDATVSSGDSVSIRLYEFMDGDFLPDVVDMADEEVTVTIHYQDADGDASTRTFAVPIA